MKKNFNEIVKIVDNKKEEYKNNKYIYWSGIISNIFKNNPKSLDFQLKDYPGILLDRMSDYQVCVVSFSLVAQIPIFILPIKEGNNDNKNATNFYISLTYEGNIYTEQCIYVADNNRASKTIPPSQNNGLQDNSQGYYNIYSFHCFLDMVNTAILKAYNRMSNDNELSVSEAPYFIYNEESGLISLICQYQYSQEGAPNIWMNSMLYNYFDSIRIYFNGRGNSNYLDYKIIIKDYGNNAWNNYQNLNPPNYLNISQEYDTRYFYANIRSILFISNMATRLEAIPNINNPNQIKDNNNFSENPFSPNMNKVLTTFDILFTSGVEWRQPIQYSASSLDRWIDLVSNDPLNNIEISVYLQYINNELIPLTIPINQSCNIKLAFRKKIN